MENTGKVGTYIRPSTERQDDQHQRDSITRYIDEHGLPQDRVEQYVDIESGSSDEREQFNALLDAIRNDEFDHVIVWEISRQGLSNIHKDPKRRRWYLDGESDDERVTEALKEVSPENS